MKQDVRVARKTLFLQTILAVVTGWLCCITPLALLMLGIASVSTAASIDRVLNGEYAWAFRGVALVFLMLAVLLYFRRRGVCTLDQARRERNRIISTTLLTLVFAVGGYLALWYLIGYWGAALGLPWRPRRWEILWSGVLLGMGLLLHGSGRLVRHRRSRRLIDG